MCKKTPRPGRTHLLLGNPTRTAPLSQRAAATAGVSRLAHSTPQLYEGLVDITGTRCSLDHGLGTLPQEVKGSFTFRGCVNREKPADQATDVSIQLTIKIFECRLQSR